MAAVPALISTFLIVLPGRWISEKNCSPSSSTPKADKRHAHPPSTITDHASNKQRLCVNCRGSSGACMQPPYGVEQ
eukprot:scaffold174619_cov22-Tisochrysis_lutea.AAC.1